MKVRMGFVSNSSSSSFIAIVPLKELSGLIDKMNDLEALLFKSMISKPRLFGNEEVFIFEQVTGEASYWEPPEGAKKFAEQILKEMGEEVDQDYINDIIWETYYDLKLFIQELPDHKRITHSMHF